MKHLLLSLLVTINLQVFALDVPAGTTMTIGHSFITSNIIIHENATLIITGDLKMGNPDDPTEELYILVHDRAKIESSGGSITGRLKSSGVYNWYGIIVEATTFPSSDLTPALNLNNFAIKNARKAIDLTRYYDYSHGVAAIFLINRKIEIRNTVFDENTTHINGAYHTYFDVPVPTWSQSNADHEVNEIIFEDCQFLNAYDVWPIHLVKMSNILFTGCFFDNFNFPESDNTFMIHLRNVQKMDIINSTFRHSGKVGIVFHGEGNEDIYIYNNRFEFDINNPLPIGYSGIGIGYELTYGSATDIRITHNRFINTSDNQEGIAIAVGLGIPSTELSGTRGYIHQGLISNNRTEGFNFGIGVCNDNEGLMHYSTAQDLTIRRNTFTDYNIGLSISNKNAGTLISCNSFKEGDVGFLIDNYPGTQFAHWGPEDKGNAFIGSSMDIQNLFSTTNFNYSRNPSNVYGADVVSTNVTTYAVSEIINCSLPEAISPTVPTSELETHKIKVFPNPSKGYFTVELMNTADFKSIHIYNQTGKLITQLLNKEKRKTFSFDLSNEPAGIYFLKLITENGTEIKKIILQ